MNKGRLRLLRRVRAVRERVRDVALGASLVAEQQRQSARGQAHEAETQLSQLLDHAQVRLSSATSVRNLYETAAVIEDGRQLSQGRARAAEAAAAEHERLRLLALRRERELRAVERALDRTRTHLARAEQKDEQIAADDMSASRQARKR